MLLALTSSGGMPPANDTFLEIYLNGRAALSVGNSLAEGEPQDEAGLYGMDLPKSEVTSIEYFIAANSMFDMPEEYGDIRADSGFTRLYLFSGTEEKNISWGPFSKVPQSIQELEKRLNQVRRSIRKHPLQAIKVTLGLVEEVMVGEEFHLNFSIRNQGSEPVALQIFPENSTRPSVFKLYAAKQNETLATSQVFFDLYQQAQYSSSVRFAGPLIDKTTIELAPGEVIKMRALAPFKFGSSGNYQLYGFAEPALELISSGKPKRLECFLATRPIAVNVR